MRILPVVDLLQGAVVHAQRGERDRYRAIQSALCPNGEPGQLAAVLADHFLFDAAYVADLNAILGGDVQWPALTQIREAGLRLWLDLGLRCGKQLDVVAIELDRHGLADSRLVVGLETWQSPDELPAVVQNLGPERLVFSVDLKSGTPMKGADPWAADVLTIVEQVLAAGFTQLLLLDLAVVGTGAGPALVGLCCQINSRWPGVHVACGGGIRDLADCRRLAEAGCDVALVATALHHGGLSAADIRHWASGAG